MNSLYESILKSTKSGKDHFLKWSKLYHHDEYKQASKDFCKFYDVRAGMLKKNIDDLFMRFVQKDIESFRFVQDYYTEEKIVDNTNVSLKEIQELKSLTISGVHVYLIIRTDVDKCYIWSRNTQMFDRIYYSELSKYLSN